VNHLDRSDSLPVSGRERSRLSARIPSGTPGSHGGVENVLEWILEVWNFDTDSCEPDPPLRDARGGSLRCECVPDEFSERHLRMNLEDPCIGGRQLLHLQDAMPHPVALDARSRPAPVEADRLRVLIRGCLQDEARKGGEHARPLLCHEHARLPICDPPRLGRQTDRDVDANRSRLGPYDRETSDLTRQARAYETSILETDGQPLASAGVDADHHHGADANAPPPCPNTPIGRLHKDQRRSNVRVVVWNIANNNLAFDALARLNPDVALLNEASPPPTLNGIWREATEGRDTKRRPWSAGVLSPHRVEEITDARPSWRNSRGDVRFACSRPGSWVAARVVVVPGFELTAVALYGLMDEFSDAALVCAKGDVCVRHRDREKARFPMSTAPG
jgi:hypothetical protein